MVVSTRIKSVMYVCRTLQTTAMIYRFPMLLLSLTQSMFQDLRKWRLYFRWNQMHGIWPWTNPFPIKPSESTSLTNKNEKKLIHHFFILGHHFFWTGSIWTRYGCFRYQLHHMDCGQKRQRGQTGREPLDRLAGWSQCWQTNSILEL